MHIRLLGLTDGFYDEIKTLAVEGENDDQMAGFGGSSSGMGRLEKRKVKI